jgi:glutamate--cysteine ligase
MLAEDFTFERYVDWLLDVPMYFVARNGRLIDVAGASFRDYLAGRVEALAGLTPTISDFTDHITTVFPEVRLKTFLEMRGADAGTPAMMLAQSALWVGLLYDETALSAAHDLVAPYSHADLLALRAAVPREGLAIAASGLHARGLGEEEYLSPLHEIVAGAHTQAEHWLARYETAWGGDVTRIFAEAEV